MKTSVVLTLDTRKPKNDQTCPILLRITHFGKSADIRTGTYVKPKEWDADLRAIKPSYRGTESVTRLNNQLQKKKTRATDIITKMDEQKTLNSYDVYQLRDLIEKKNDGLSFFDYGQQLVDDLNKAKQLISVS